MTWLLTSALPLLLYGLSDLANRLQRASESP